MASGAEAGELSHALPLSLPAAAVTTIPAVCAAATARLKAFEKPPPRDMQITPGWPERCASVTDHSIAWMTRAVLPVPEHESACTGTTVACAGAIRADNLASGALIGAPWWLPTAVAGGGLVGAGVGAEKCTMGCGVCDVYAQAWRRRTQRRPPLMPRACHGCCSRLDD